MKILALDLGKFNTMCCFFDTKTRKHEFLTAATERNYLTTVFKKHEIDLVVMEACGPSGWINDLAVSLGHKTLDCRINKMKCTIRAWFVNHGIAIDSGEKAWNSGRARINSFRKPLAECHDHELWNAELDLELTQLDAVTEQLEAVIGRLEAMGKKDPRIQRIMTFPGVGPRTAEILVECAWASLRYNAWAKAIYERISGKQKTRKKKAAVALARKFSVIAWALLRDEKDWEPKRMIEVTESFGKMPVALKDTLEDMKPKENSDQRKSRLRKEAREAKAQSSASEPTASAKATTTTDGNSTRPAKAASLNAEPPRSNPPRSQPARPATLAVPEPQRSTSCKSKPRRAREPVSPSDARA